MSKINIFAVAIIFAVGMNISESYATENADYLCSDFAFDSPKVGSMGVFGAGTHAAFWYGFASGVFFGATSTEPQKDNPELEGFISSLIDACKSRPSEALLMVATELSRTSLLSQRSVVMAANIESDTNEKILDSVDTSPQQDAFNLAVADFRDAYANAPNEMAAGGQRQKRAKALCKILTDVKVSRWTGFITKLSSTSDGRGVLTIETGKGVSVTTWNNALSDLNDNSLLSINNPVFEIAMNLPVGQAVEFSGTFIRDKNDCIREGSLTQSGSMKNPAFIMRFTSLKQLGGTYQPAKSSSKKTPRRKSLLLQMLEGE